ncbi:hypothetical protein [Kineosporia succinea]|uniref:Uncharacterized protein n=1 Tax=Kineosporia succinea TaxID=84632 RepID=A0ABT9P9I6_9ACTN|nr:hypothetical protein [Kineosporia succinea]MDP9829360.1 hypothetical protein [Kineosporia succinea]
MAWFNTSGRYLPEIMAAVNAESGGRMSSPICGNESEPSPDGEVYVCTRAPQHKAWRHIAVGAGVVAAWPRDHEPVLADVGEAAVATPPAIPDQPAEGAIFAEVCVIAEHVCVPVAGCNCDHDPEMGMGHQAHCGWEPVAMLSEVPKLLAERDRARATAASLEARWEGFRRLLLGMWGDASDAADSSGGAEHRYRKLALSDALDAMREYPHGDEGSDRG